MLLAVPAQAHSADRSTADVIDAVTGEVKGESQLVRTNSGISMNLRTTGLDPGHAYTIWWVVFNNPDDCQDGQGMIQCGMADLTDPDVHLTLATAAGHIIGNSGRGNFGGALKAGDDSNLTGEGTVLDSKALMNPRGAEVHLVVRDHGPLVPEWLPDQIQTFGGGCDQSHADYPPPLVGEGVDGGADGFACFDPQFSIHLAD
jgi:hypothetical protein